LPQALLLLDLAEAHLFFCEGEPTKLHARSFHETKVSLLAVWISNEAHQASLDIVFWVDMMMWDQCSLVLMELTATRFLAYFTL
jgi:hypothetical protein